MYPHTSFRRRPPKPIKSSLVGFQIEICLIVISLELLMKSNYALLYKLEGLGLHVSCFEQCMFKAALSLDCFKIEIFLIVILLEVLMEFN